MFNLFKSKPQVGQIWWYDNKYSLSFGHEFEVVEVTPTKLVKVEFADGTISDIPRVYSMNDFLHFFKKVK